MRPGYVYVVSDAGGMQKIGVSRDPSRRIISLAPQGQGELSLAVSFYRERGDAGLVENLAHRLLEGKRGRGEWFDVTQEEAVEAVRVAIQRVEAGEVRTPRQRWPGSSNQIAFRIDPDDLASFRAAAAVDKRTLSSLLTKIIKEWLDQYPSGEMRRALDRWRLEQSDTPSRAEAVRRIVHQFLIDQGFMSQNIDNA